MYKSIFLTESALIEEKPHCSRIIRLKMGWISLCLYNNNDTYRAQRLNTRPFVFRANKCIILGALSRTEINIITTHCRVYSCMCRVEGRERERKKEWRALIRFPRTHASFRFLRYRNNNYYLLPVYVFFYPSHIQLGCISFISSCSTPASTFPQIAYPVVYVRTVCNVAAAGIAKMA